MSPWPSWISHDARTSSGSLSPVCSSNLARSSPETPGRSVALTAGRCPSNHVSIRRHDPATGAGFRPGCPLGFTTSLSSTADHFARPSALRHRLDRPAGAGPAEEDVEPAVEEPHPRRLERIDTPPIALRHPAQLLPVGP